MAVRDVLAFLPAYLLGAGGTALRRHSAPSTLRRWSDRLRAVTCSGLLRLLLAGLLLASHCLLLALAGARVGLRALTVHRETAAVPQALVAADLDLAPDVRLHLAAQVTFDLVVGLDPVPEAEHVFITQLVHPGVAADASGVQRLERAGPADAVDVGK